MKKIFKNFLSIGFASIVGQLITFLTMTYYAQVLGKNLFGNVTLIQQIMLYFSTLVLFGLQTYSVRHISCNKDKIEEFLGDIIVFRLLVSVISFIIIIILSFFIKKDFEFQTILILFGFTLFPMALNIDWFFNGIEVMKHNAIYTLIKNIAPSSIIFIIIKINCNVIIIPIATFVGLFLGFVYQYYILIFKLKMKIKVTLSYNRFKKYLYIGIPFLTSGLLSMINNNCDKIILGFTRSPDELGIYQAAYIFISFFINVEGLLFTPVFPSFSKHYYNKNFNELQNICEFTAKIIVMVVTPLLVGGIILSKEIILLFYKVSYIDAYKPFIVLLVYVFILFIREIYAYELNAWGFEKIYLKVIFTSSMINLILNLILTPIYGYMVAAFITAITEMINLIFMRIKTRTVIKTKEFNYILKIIPFTAIMGIMAVGMKLLSVPLVINIAISASCYVFLVLKSKYVNLKCISEILK